MAVVMMWRFVRGGRRNGRRVQSAHDRGVVGLRAAAGEDHLGRRTAQQVGYPTAGAFDRLAGGFAGPVGARRVAVLYGQKRPIASCTPGAVGVLAL